MTNLVGPNTVGDGRVEAIAQRLIEQLRESKDSRRLPSERRLATLLGCSRNTIREALARLRERGLIDVRSRSGAYERPPESGSGTRSGQALAALELYAEAFDAAGALPKLEAFASFNGPDFYRLPRNTGKVTLEKQSWTVPPVLAYAGDDELVPLRAGEVLSWKFLG